MLRLVDAPAAIAARGYPAGASVSARLDLTDPVRPTNSGCWALEVSDGAGQLTRLADAAPGTSADALRLGSRGLAALYAGVPVATLRLAGPAAGGDPAADESLDSAFRGPGVHDRLLLTAGNGAAPLAVPLPPPPPRHRRRIFMDQRYVAGSAERDTGLESLRATNNLRDANM